MSDSWDTRRKALEEEYFQKKDAEALARIQSRQNTTPRLSPVTGEPLEQRTIMGVVVDQCPKTGGIWLDNGELEEILKAATHQESETGKNLLAEFFATITGR
ncbi:zf-TFIIB domain-containing protein [bacterium]|nr:zf-TFIIB domain-containing protein [bacterium]